MDAGKLSGLDIGHRVADERVFAWFGVEGINGLGESDQVDMVLSDGARDRGALADQISADPWIGAGVGYVRLEASPDPVRVRAAYVTDADIMAMADAVGYLPGGGL